MKAAGKGAFGLAVWIAVSALPFLGNAASEDGGKNETLFFFDREMHFCAARPLPRLYVEIRRVLPVGSREWTEACKAALGELWSEKIEPYGAGLLVTLSGNPRPEEVVATAAALRNRDSVRFAYPLVETAAGPCVPLPRVEFSFDPRLSLQERDQICRTVEENLHDLFGSGWTGRVDKSGEGKGIVLGVPDPFLVARRLALSQAKGIRWALPSLETLRNPVEMTAALVRPGGEEAQSMAVLLGNRIELRLTVRVGPTAQIDRDAPLRSLSELAIRSTRGDALLPAFLERGEPREEIRGERREIRLPLRFYHTGEFRIELGSIPYREGDRPIRSTQSPALTLRVVGLAGEAVTLHPLKWFAGWSGQTRPVRGKEQGGPWLLLGLGLLLVTAGGWLAWTSWTEDRIRGRSSESGPAKVSEAAEWVRRARERWEQEEDLASVRKLAWRLLEKSRAGEASASSREICLSLLKESEAVFADGTCEESFETPGRNEVTNLLRLLEREVREEAKR
ncbi:hypothetical protein MAMC_00481 [Methylacidimicrobium cyclopophantes]|uniref:Oxygen tolerance n=1 Tax=Methylacidimicrobium cyclopophantes TaxID=1041766 RepID=A0A5E6M6R8_9BACT|nr:hypothetical protein [Methylacidimicrobium cyclopophantes]VVM05249.1 hypothetical protein MAMC_00481 [Methylacidimicrobium cyclopophantes]